MKRLQWLLVMLALGMVALPGEGQFFFKKPRPVPAQRVPELILTIKADADERKRAAAADELREYDTKTFTEIMPVLIDVLNNDKKVNVRLEALSSLSRMRPVSQSAGQAIEHAASSDESLRVRLQAKTALLKYHLAGYSSSNKNEPSALQPSTQEPPLADAPSVAIPAVAFPPSPGAAKVTPPGLGNAGAAQPTVAQPIGPALDVPRPLPKGVSLPPGQAAPAPMIQIEGPALPPRPF